MLLIFWLRSPLTALMFWLVAKSCFPVTASVLVLLRSASATFFSLTGGAVPLPPRVTAFLVSSSYFTANPVSTLMLLIFWLRSPLTALMFWLVAKSCFPVTASVLVLVRLASATFFSLTGVVLSPSVTAFLSVPSYFTATPSRAVILSLFAAMRASLEVIFCVLTATTSSRVSRLPLTVLTFSFVA